MTEQPFDEEGPDLPDDVELQDDGDDTHVVEDES
jgi:hypothetical protein